MIAYACYDSDNILTSGKTMKKEVLCDMIFDLYMPPPGEKNDIKEEKMSHVDMCLNGIGKFKGLWNMEEDEKNGEMLILSKKNTHIRLRDVCGTRLHFSFIAYP